MNALCQQVNEARSSAMEQGFLSLKSNERDIVTVISRPMWNAFLKEVSDIMVEVEPTEWIGKETIRVNGSDTRIVESDKLFAVSYCSLLEK